MRKILERSAVLFVSVLEMGLLASCGSTSIPGQPGGGTSPQTKYLAVADTGNNRILIYDAPFTTGQSAGLVLGQPDFGQATFSLGTSTASAMTPMGMAVDAMGDLFVADIEHCRVLEFQPPFTTDMNASVVFGQSTFTQGSSGVCETSDQFHPPSPALASGLDAPIAVAIDSQGDLWVADYYGTRILEYVPPFSNDMTASIAIGQPNLDTTSVCDGDPSGVYPPPSASTLCYPSDIDFDAKGDLWVADWLNARVLEFTPPFSTGMSASLEIGQPVATAFTSAADCNDNGGRAVSASCLAPGSLAFDSAGNLWLVDQYNERVLEFSPPFTTGMSASAVLGQPDFTTGALQAPAANTFDFEDEFDGFEGGVWIDPGGDMYVADSGNSRVLLFHPPLTSGMGATMVIGQPNMTTGTPILSADGCAAPSANNLCYPERVLTFDEPAE